MTKVGGLPFVEDALANRQSTSNGPLSTFDSGAAPALVLITSKRRAGERMVKTEDDAAFEVTAT